MKKGCIGIMVGVFMAVGLCGCADRNAEIKADFKELISLQQQQGSRLDQLACDQADLRQGCEKLADTTVHALNKHGAELKQQSEEMCRLAEAYKHLEESEARRRAEANKPPCPQPAPTVIFIEQQATPGDDIVNIIDAVARARNGVEKK